MNIQIEIDKGSGFCLGVTRAIKLAEEKLTSGGGLCCLGDIVHNGRECERLNRMGMRTINHDELAMLRDARVLLRAHGEPPSTYSTARSRASAVSATTTEARAVNAENASNIATNAVKLLRRIIQKSDFSQ